MKNTVRVLLVLTVLSAAALLTAKGDCASSCVNGVCTDNKCICNKNWYGGNCTEFVCQANDPCLKGTCQKVNENDFQCVCEEGYGGILCDCNEGIQPITLCPSDGQLNCGDYGTCTVNPANKTAQVCTCAPGYGGKLCEVEVDHCLTRGCGVGVCTNVIKDDKPWYNCSCPEGYDPKTECGPIYDSCFDEPCVHGACSVPVPHLDKDYICTCDRGYTGKNCSVPITHCNDDTCLNGGSCAELLDFSGYNCTCPPYFIGDNCQTPYDPCSECNTCSNNGTCVSDYQEVSVGVYSYTTGCNCTSRFSGSRCESDINECEALPSPCLNEGTCVNTLGSYLCSCAPGYSGDVCEININECDGDPCSNGGICRDEVNGFTCECNGTQFTGPTCTIPRNLTCEVQGCHFRGICEFDAELRKPVCTCMTGYSGDLCLYAYQPCSNGSCDPEGTMECIQDSPSSNIVCRCRDGFSGPTCNINVWNSCKYNDCLNNGTCSDVNGTFHCSCPSGFSGRNCEIGTVHQECQSELECKNGGECIRVLDVEFCKCTAGWGGEECSFDIDECYLFPCKNGGTCRNAKGSYECTCPNDFEGANCEQLKSNCEQVHCENGGSCVQGGRSNDTVCNCLEGFEGDRCEKEVCPYSNCTVLANNKECDYHCFSAACNFDGGSNCYTTSGSDPWANCSIDTVCRNKYNDGYCDQECNNARCLYDGSDCSSATTTEICSADIVARCQELEGNGECDSFCNTNGCQLDVADCGRALYLPNYLILIVKSKDTEKFDGERQDRFLFDLGALIHALVELVEKREIQEEELAREGYIVNLAPSPSSDKSYKYYRLVLSINIQFCESSCPTTIEQVLNQIQAAYSNGQTNIGGFGIVDAVSGDIPSDSSGNGGTNAELIVGVCAGILVAIGLVGAVAFVLGKRARNDGGVGESIRKVVRVRGTFRIPGGATPEPLEANLMTRGQSCSSDRNSGSLDAFDDPSPSSIRKSNTSLPHFTWSQMEVPVKTGSKEGATCVVGHRGKDERKWTYLHCEAARMSGDGRDFMHNSLADVNTQGPGGLTPLMVAIMSEDKHHRSRARPGSSVRSDSSSGSDYSEYDPMMISQSPKFPRMFSTIPHSKPYESKIPSLIHAPQCNVNLINDHGESALHLAVKHSRDEYIHYLLMAKADPNVQDKWGKTPLHVAIGAANDRAFQILVECSRINLELKSHGGITPLMLAVKMGNHRVLQQLISKNAEITATDIEGRTAVHWAAMINNVEALRLLIKQGPDNVKDAPNHKGETALFLACREGCLGAVRHLLDCYANATLVDSLERSPLQIAYEKHNLDVVEMLQQSNQGPLGGPSPPLYTVKASHSASNPMFGRTSTIKMEPPSAPTIQPPVIHSQSASMPPRHDAYQYHQSEGMTRYSSIEAELERLVASTQYPDMLTYSGVYTSEPHPVVSQPAHVLNTSPNANSDGGHSPGHSIISPPGSGLSPGESNHSNFSPVSSEVYSPQAGLIPYSGASNPPSSSSTGQQVFTTTGSTPLQHLAAVHSTTSELQSTSMEPPVYTSTMPANNNSPLMGQTVSPNPTSMTIAQATMGGAGSGYSSSTQQATGSNSPSSQYGFPSPPKEAGEYGAYGTPYNGEHVNSVNSMTPSPEDGSSHQGDGSPLAQQYTTAAIHGQYTCDPYQFTLQPCNAAIRGSQIPGLSTSFNPKESTV